MDRISAFKLKNEGGFVCAGEIQYIDPSDGSTQRTTQWSPLNITEDEMMNPADRQLSSGTLVQMYIRIIWGDDRTGGTYFIYDPSSPKYADYWIDGTTLNSSVHYEGLKDL